MVLRQTCSILNLKSILLAQRTAFIFFPCLSSWQRVNHFCGIDKSVSSIPAGKRASGRCMLCQKVLNEELVRIGTLLPSPVSTVSACHPVQTVLSSPCRKKQAEQQPNATFILHQASRHTFWKLPSPRRLLKPSRKRPNSCFNNVSLYSCHTYYSRLSNHSAHLNESYDSPAKRD